MEYAQKFYFAVKICIILAAVVLYDGCDLQGKEGRGVKVTKYSMLFL